MKQTLARITVGEDDVDHQVFIETFRMTGEIVCGSMITDITIRLVVALTMPGLTPGIENRISGWFEFDSVTPDPEHVDRRVQTLMTNLREQRLRLVKNIERAAVGGN